MIRTQKEYFEKVTNLNNLKLVNTDPKLIKFQEIIEEEVVSGYRLIDDLMGMSNQKKIALIIALVRNDQQEIDQILYDSILRLGITVEHNLLRNITEITDYHEKGYWVNSVVSVLMQGMLSDCTDIDRARILQMAMQKIPDTEITIQVKKRIISEINPNAARIIEAYAYLEPLKLMEENRYSGDFTKNEYFEILRNDKLDVSEFIICTIGLLQGLVQTPREYELLKKIRISYDRVEYLDAIVLIQCIFDEETFQPEQYRSASNYIKQKAEDAYMPNIAKNYTRRFYENRLIQLGINRIDLTKVNKISSIISDVIANTIDELGSIPNAALMTDIARAFDRNKELLHSSERMRHRNRMRKEGILQTHDDNNNYQENKNEKSDEIWSRNAGVMTSNQPNYQDEISLNSMRNRSVDKYIMRGRGEATDHSYLAAYVSSMSGHAFYIVALLEDYMEIKQDDPALNFDINNYLKAVIIAYVMNGYHSIFEIVDVLEVPAVKDVFKKYGVHLDLNWQDDIIEKAMLDTQEYTKTICLKKVISTRIALMNQSEIDKVAYEHLINQITTIEEAIIKPKNDPTFFNAAPSFQNEVVANILDNLKLLKLESKDQNADLRKISRDICILIRSSSEQISSFDKNDSKFAKIVAGLAEKVYAENKSIEDLFTNGRGNALLKPGELKRK